MCRRDLKFIVILSCFSFEILQTTNTESESQVRGWFEPGSCTKNQYFDTDTFECKKCSNDLVSSEDGLECVCDKNSRVVAIKKGNPVCDSCGAGKIRTTDGYECISCRKDGATCGCWGNQIIIERNWNGTVLDKLQCLPCPKNTFSSSDHSQCLPCVPAVTTLTRRGHRENIPLDDAPHENMAKYCMPQNSPKDWPDVRNTYLNKFKEKSVDSYYFRTELRFTTYLCENGDRKSCVHLGNMCALTLFTDSQPCKHFMRKTDDNPTKLFYRDGEARTILNARTIEQRYTLDQKDPNNKLKLIVAAFRLRGGLDTISEPILSCPFFNNLSFGVNLKKVCKISSNELINEKMIFFVPYLEHFDPSNANKKLLHPLPVLIKNNEYTNEDDVTRWKLVSRFFSVDKITGYKAIPHAHNASFAKSPELEVLRYLKSLSLVVKVQERNERGKIFPPLLVVEYDELTNRKIIENVEVSVEYKVTYRLPDDESSSAIEVCIGVFTGIAVGFSAIKAWSYSRRSYENVPNIATISWFIIYCFGAIGNILLLICSSACLYTFVFYKGQKVVHILLPNDANEWTIRVCTIVAFAFKTVEILSLMYQQRRVNIFFIDWEQPRRNVTSSSPAFKCDSPHTSLRKSYSTDRFYPDARNTMQSASEVIGARRNKTPSKSSQASTPSRQSIGSKILDRTEHSDIPPRAGICSETNFSIDEHQLANNYSVSIWRTCIVANEWLKIKTKRKINVLLQILATLFILEIIGGKYWSTATPELTLERHKMLSIDESFTLEYAVGIFVYAIVYSVQWWFSVFVYEKYIKNRLQEFVDLCSMANISVFILSHDFYGYYIHGRSVHGFADTDLLTLINDLKREENNLCAHRGLIPGTTEQTFVISVSKTFRSFYDRLLGSQNLSDGKFLRRNVSNIPNDFDDERWETHLKLRKFLTGFLDHCFKNVDYTVKERHFFEKMCDLEMADVDDKSVFYIDNGYSFDRTLLYGNEWSLATYEINVFLLVLVLGGNYILASVVTLLVAKAVNTVAKFNGRRLLATKTFIDERFLVS